VGFLDRFFKSKARVEEPPFETVERTISLDERQHKVVVRIHGRELFAEDFFRACREAGDYSFGRFYLHGEDLPKTHCAPSLEQAIDWFRGRGAPNDGYGTLVWGDAATYNCKICGAALEFPLRINKVEKLTVYTVLPEYQAIVGWRVLEVGNDLLGPGIPTKVLTQYKTFPIIRWESQKKMYVHQSCREKMMEMGKEEELAEYLILAPA